MNRCLKLSVLSALALASGQVLAMDLGQIQVKSALDRPLLAEIPLAEDYPGEADFVKVSLAPAEAFARAGIRREDLRVPLAFEVATNAAGQKVIRVTSTQPVHEPYLDFLIQVSWPKGRLLREYTVLLDPLSSASTPRTTATTPTSGSRTTGQADASDRQAAPPAPAPAPAPASGDDVYGPVQHGDTLSHIALANRVDGVSYQQMLVALKAANPDAFFQDNVNALKSGAVLRIPTRQEALEVTRQAAIAAVREQNQSWQSRRAPTMVASAGGSSRPVGGEEAGSGGGDRLSLVPPSEKEGAAAGAAAGSGSTSASELRRELARSKEALSSQEQAAADLKSRVEALEQLEQKNKRLLSLKNAEIAELREKLAEARKEAGLPALPASTAGAEVATAGSAGEIVMAGTGSVALADAAPVAAASAGDVTTAVTETSAAAQSAAAKARPENRPATTAATRPAPRPAVVSTPWYKRLWVQLAGLLVIVVLLAWALLRRRHGGHAPTKASLSDQFGHSPLGDDDGDGLDSDTAADIDTGADADVAADDGEGELLTRLAADPENIGLHLELASLYYARGDADRFEAIAESMHTYLDDESQPEWAEIRHMGREIAPDHPLFADEPASAGDEATAREQDLPDTADAADDSDSDAGQPLDDIAPLPEDAPRPSSGYSFDFDLISDRSGTPSDQPAAGSETDAEVPPATGTGEGMPSEDEFDSLPPLDMPADAATDTAPAEEEDISFESGPAATPEGEPDTAFTPDAGDDAADFARDGFSDDPVDTKLDLARAYIDMGDPESARSMLQEALNEGSQMQQDVARKLLDDIG